MEHANFSASTEGLIFMGYVLSNGASSIKNNVNFYIGVICTNMCVIVVFSKGGQLQHQ